MDERQIAELEAPDPTSRPMRAVEYVASQLRREKRPEAPNPREPLLRALPNWEHFQELVGFLVADYFQASVDRVADAARKGDPALPYEAGWLACSKHILAQFTRFAPTGVKQK